MNIINKLEEILIDLGKKQVKSTPKYNVWEYPGRLIEGEKPKYLYLGSSGSCRVGHTSADSIPSSWKDVLLKKWEDKHK